MHAFEASLPQPSTQALEAAASSRGPKTTRAPSIITMSGAGGDCRHGRSTSNRATCASSTRRQRGLRC